MVCFVPCFVLLESCRAYVLLLLIAIYLCFVICFLGIVPSLVDEGVFGVGGIPSFTWGSTRLIFSTRSTRLLSHIFTIFVTMGVFKKAVTREKRDKTFGV